MADEEKKPGGGWRYQPVILNNGGEPYIVLYEVTCDAEGKLVSWIDSPIGPEGGSIEDIQSDISRMLVDAYRWKAVSQSEITEGATFEKMISTDTAKGLADFVEQVRGAFMGNKQ